MIRPVVQRVAPELAVGREIIRRAACHPGKAAVRVQLEQRTADPCIHRVGRDVDGDIAEDLHALLVGVSLDLLPLEGKLILQKLPEADFLFVFGAERVQRVLLPLAVFPGPLGPALHAVFGLESHIEGVILQPVLVGEGKRIVIVRIVHGTAVLPGALPAPCGVGLPQDTVPAGIQGAVVYFQRLIAPFFGFELGSRQQAVGLERVQINEIGVARKGGAALVRAVAVTGGAQRQDLPDLLPGFGQKIHKLQRLCAKTTDPIGAGQTGHRHQNSTFTHDDPFLDSSQQIFQQFW